MKIFGTTDPSKIKTEDEKVTVYREDAQAALDFAHEVVREKNSKVRMAWEREYLRDLRERYGKDIAAAMLRGVWDLTKPEEEVL